MNRRRHSRFLLTEPWKGTLQVSDEVTIEQWVKQTITLVGRRHGRPFESMLVEWSPAGAPPARVRVRALESHPVVVDSGLWYRLRLAVLGDPPPGYTAERMPARGWLVREVQLQLCDFSEAGVLLETAAPVGVGAAGRIDVAAADGRRWSDEVRVCRSLALHGSAFVCRAGAEFLPERAGRNDLLRGALADIGRQEGARVRAQG